MERCQRSLHLSVQNFCSPGHLEFCFFSICSNWGTEDDETQSYHSGNSDPRGFGVFACLCVMHFYGSVILRCLPIYGYKQSKTLIFRFLLVWLFLFSTCKLCPTLCNLMDYNPMQLDRGLIPVWNSPGKKTGVGNHSLLQGSFLTHGLNLCLLHYRRILYHLSHQGSLILFRSIISSCQSKLYI